MLWEKSRVGSSPTSETIRVNRNYYYSSGRKESCLSAGPDPCGIDEIGRHSGLRIRGLVRMGSSPLFRTKAIIKVDDLLVVMWLYKDTRETTEFMVM